MNPEEDTTTKEDTKIEMKTDNLENTLVTDTKEEKTTEDTETTEKTTKEDKTTKVDKIETKTKTEQLSEFGIIFVS